MISSLFLDDQKLADDLRAKFCDLDIRLTDKEFYILEHTYPVYDDKLLKELFLRDEYNKKYIR